MRKPKLVLISALFAALGLIPPVFAQRAMFILRHAERAEYDEGDGPISKTGQWRAMTLARLLGEAGITTIITSDAKRAMQTAEPIARALGITPRVIRTRGAKTADDIVLTIDREKADWVADYAKKLMDEIHSRHKNDVVLIIGHQNTVPAIVRATGYSGEVKIGDYEHDDIFVVVPKEGGPPTLLHLNY